MNLATSYNPLVSVIIPVRNGAATLPSCLRAIKRSYYRNYEVIVVDDHSTDASRDIALQFKARVIDSGEGQGANHARNTGATQAGGDIFIFIDADIVITRETLLGIVETLEDDHPDAVVGLYTAKHRNESYVSQYKNLWVRYSYIKSPPAIDWLFGAISGIKREAFRKLGGFDSALLAMHGHDDIELGKRFARANLQIILNPEIEVEHLKTYTIRSFIRNEYYRSVGFADMATRLGETGRSIHRGFVNVYPSFVISVACAPFIAGITIAWLAVGVPAWLPAAAWMIYFLLNVRFLNYLEQVRGIFAMGAMIPFLYLDHLVCLIGSIAGVMKGLGERKRK